MFRSINQRLHEKFGSWKLLHFTNCAERGCSEYHGTSPSQFMQFYSDKALREAFREGLGEKGVFGLGKEITGSNVSLELDSGKIDFGTSESIKMALDRVDGGIRFQPIEVKPEIIVFTSSGKTYNFKNIENLTPTTQGFEFDYTGVATGVKRHAAFNYTSVAGYALA